MSRGDKMRIAAILCFMSFLAAAGWCDNTLRGKLKPLPRVADADTVAATQPFDTLMHPAASLVRLSGYDKPLRASIETMFVTNNLQVEILQLSLRLNYIDMSGRQLHERDVEVRIAIPPGATRQLKIKSWDTQKSFYYYRGQKPKVNAVTPYKVECAVNSCVVETPNIIKK